MKKIPVVLAVLFLLQTAGAQNIGVGTNSPTEKLHVNGNINLGGNLKINGMAGQNGDVLMTNSAGSTVWTSLNEYKNFIVFGTTTGWFVPAGVTKILVEVWGAGGGGAVGGGGGSGGYTTAVINVTPGLGISIVIGLGGSGAILATTAGSDGGASSVNIPPDNYAALGGGGANVGRPGLGGGGNSSSTLMNIMYLKGNDGEPSTEGYAQVNATEFAKMIKYGNGGNAPRMNSGGGRGGFLSTNTTNGQNLKQVHSTMGTGFGAGGGGGTSINNNPFGGSYGADGMVIIWY